MENDLLQGLACLLETRDLQPLIGQIGVRTSSEIVQIRILGKDVAWIPLADILNAAGTGIEGSYYDSFSRTVAAGVMATRQPVDVPDSSELHSPSQSLSKYELKSFACFPMLAGDEAIGVIFIASLRYRPALDAEVTRTLNNIAQTLAGILKREHWYEELLKERNRTGEGGAYGIITADGAMQHIIDLLPRYAQTKAPVLILGETGTGKERIAAALHTLSSRRKKPFVKVHCGAISESLIESELFGHEKGAFTGAVKTTDGFFGMADGGTIFLDEISTASLEVQVKLLRVLESGEITRVGSARQRSVDVRIIAAGNQNLHDLVARGRFRQDLYYRLKVLEIYLPPLRDRPADIRPLAQYFLEHYTMQHEKFISGFSDAALNILQAQHWAGNVRQLRHCVESLVIHADSSMLIRQEQVSRVLSNGADTWQQNGYSAILPPQAPALDYKQFRDQHLHSAEREFLMQHLSRNQWSEAKTARELKMPRSTLIHRIKVLEIEKQ